jgi:hypothetical protein
VGDVYMALGVVESPLLVSAAFTAAGLVRTIDVASGPFGAGVV